MTLQGSGAGAVLAGYDALPARLALAAERADPVADELVAAARDRLGTPFVFQAWLDPAPRNDEPLPPRRAAALAGLLPGALPPFAEPLRLLRAQRFAQRHLLQITTCLFGAALPSAYAGAKGALVLARTRRLETDIDRRIHDTGRFVLDVLAEGAFEPQGSAFGAIARVRLLHAAIRQQLAPTHVGVPINQEELLGTALTFSVVVLDALERLGGAVEPAEAEDFLHLWRVTAALLGVDDHDLLGDLWTARRTRAAIERRHVRPSAHGRALTQRLIAAMQRYVPAERHDLEGVVAHLAGERVADALGIQPSRHRPAPSGWLRRLDGLVGRRLVPALLAAAGARPDRRLPAS